MIDYKEVESLSEGGNIRMPEFVQASFFPLNPYAWMLFIEALRSGDERRQRSAVVPGDATQRHLVHAVCSTREETRTFSPLLAERHAASITSIAATPRVAGDRLLRGSWIESIRFIAGA